MSKHISVAIDGPSGAGKSTLAKSLAAELQFLYVDTGAIYRTIGYYAWTHNIDPKDADAVEAALPADTEQHLYRILLTGETAAAGVNIAALRETFAERFYALELRDQTRMAEDVWARAEEDSLRGLFLRELKGRLAQANTEEERAHITRAARFGLAALDGRDLG